MYLCGKSSDAESVFEPVLESNSVSESLSCNSFAFERAIRTGCEGKKRSERRL